jgi:hypothetical protein
MVNGQRLMLTYIPCLLVILNCFDAWHEGALEHRMFQLDDALHKDTRIAQFDAFCVGHVIMTAPPAQASPVTIGNETTALNNPSNMQSAVLASVVSVRDVPIT